VPVLVICPACQARYNIDDAKIAGRRTKATCKRCQRVFSIEPAESSWDDATVPEGPPADREVTYPGVAASTPSRRELTPQVVPEPPRPPAEGRPGVGLRVGVRHGAQAQEPAARPAAPAAPDRVSIPPASGPSLRLATRVAPPASATRGPSTSGTAADRAPTPAPATERPAPRGPKFVVHSQGDDEQVDPTRAAMLAGAGHPPPVPPAVPAPTIAPTPIRAAPPAAPPAPAAFTPPPAPAPPRPSAQPWTPEEASVLAPTLDFGRVGVLTWRARAPDGRVYDFTSLRSLRTQLSSGRLTAAAALSPDGQAWTRIGDIRNLDVFFVETWEQLSVARGGAPLVRPDPVVRAAPRPEAPIVDASVPPPAPTPRAAPPAPRAAPPAPVAARPEPEPPRAPEPYLPRAPAAFRRPWYEAPAIVLLMLFSFVGGALAHWVFTASLRPERPAPTATVAPPPAAPGAAVPVPARTDPGIPTYTVGGTRSAGTTGGGSAPRGQASAGTRPAPTAAPDPRTDAIVAATQLQPAVAPGEGAAIEGTENTGPSEFIMVEEIPASKADAALRKEGLK